MDKLTKKELYILYIAFLLTFFIHSAFFHAFCYLLAYLFQVPAMQYGTTILIFLVYKLVSVFLGVRDSGT